MVYKFFKSNVRVLYRNLQRRLQRFTVRCDVIQRTTIEDYEFAIRQ